MDSNFERDFWRCCVQRTGGFAQAFALAQNLQMYEVPKGFVQAESLRCDVREARRDFRTSVWGLTQWGIISTNVEFSTNAK
ncbi:MAG: hypothetical protein KDD49_11045 [Bacteroidetes bacterium]|nr:hypothetical protein [Bacteroidota bacterium]MCB9044118.1 hypothetical protein [Chitinophagales bacterium]